MVSVMDNIMDWDYETRELIVLEALLRRIAYVNKPFVLKGSLLTRQYLSNRKDRDVGDIDLLYAEKIQDVEQACEIFTNWMTQVTELDLDDGIVFRSFQENAFWRYIDYAMSEDFPTINTDLEYYVKGQPRKANEYSEIGLDVSFNLEMGVVSVPLQYQPFYGESFLVPYTVPLSIQVSWKLHQTIVRPRFKDLYDLNYLLSHPSYDKLALQETLQALVNECSIDQSITKEHIKKVLVDDLQELYPSLTNDYDLRKYAGSSNKEIYYTLFVSKLRNLMDAVGLNEFAFEYLPEPKEFICSIEKIGENTVEENRIMEKFSYDGSNWRSESMGEAIELEIREIRNYYYYKIQCFDYNELVSLGISHDNADFMTNISVPEESEEFVFYGIEKFQKLMIEGVPYIKIGYEMGCSRGESRGIYFKVGSDELFATYLHKPQLYIMNKNLRTFFLFHLIRYEVAKRLRQKGEYVYHFANELKRLYGQIDPGALKDVESYWSHLIEFYENGY